MQPFYIYLHNQPKVLVTAQMDYSGITVWYRQGDDLLLMKKEVPIPNGYDEEDIEQMLANIFFGFKKSTQS